MDEKTLRFLRLMREQLRDKSTGRDKYTREVSSGAAARELGMDPGYPEYETRLADLMGHGYLHPHPNPTLNAQGLRLITTTGVAAADDG